MEARARTRGGVAPVANAATLRERLATLRHLSPIAYLPAPPTSDARQLLHELMVLGDQTDPIAWVAQRRGSMAARLALQAELLRLHDVLLERQATPAGAHARLHTRAYRDLLDVPPDLAEFTALRCETLPPRDVFAALLRQLRAYRGPVPGTGGLLAEVMALPLDVDPVDWLGQRRGYSAALLAVASLLDACRPPSTLDIGHVLGRRWIHREIRTPRCGRLEVINLILGSAGFSVSLKTRLRDLPAAAVDDVDALWAWLGFGRVADDRGYRYLPRHQAIRTERRLVGSGGQHITMVFYPGLDAEAHVLSLSPAQAVFADVDPGRWVHQDRTAGWAIGPRDAIEVQVAVR